MTGIGHYPPADAAKGLMVRLGLWPIAEPAMVRVPAGEFRMGDLAGNGYDTEQPVQPVRFAQPFEIGLYEVTFEEYDLFAAATGREEPNDQGWRPRGDRPVINVDWNDAVAYAKWLSGKTGKQYRLPTEAEWEYAARAGTDTSRYWKESPEQKPDPACTYANVFDRGNVDRIKATYNVTWEPFECDDPFPFTAPVGRFQPNERRLHDMMGNVWERAQDCWHDNYEGAPEGGLAWELGNPDDCGARVVRGGSWTDIPGDVRSSVRGGNEAGARSDNLGFRLARSL